MSDKKVLPMSYPCITSYPMHANMLACVAQYEDSMQWFYNYYVQICMEKDLLNRYCFIDFCVPQSWKSCPWFHFQRINRELVEKGWDSISKFILDCIDSDYYVYLYLDQFYIPEARQYQTRHFAHDSFIYGYDRLNEQFNIADFYQHFKYSFSTISFSQISKAFEDKELLESADQLGGIILVKPEKYEYFRFDVKLLRSFIEDYLQSKPCRKRYTDNYRIDIGDNRDLWVYGLEVYSYILKYLELVLEQKVLLDLRAFQVLVDHKTLMISRIKYLADNKMLTEADFFYREFEAIKHEFMLIRNQAIRSFVTGNKEGVKKIISRIPQVIIKERDTLEKLLENLVD